MARVDVAYVEVRPDLTGFSTSLKTALAKVNLTEKVHIEPDESGIAAASLMMKALRREQRDAMSEGLRDQVNALDNIAKDEFRMQMGLSQIRRNLIAKETKEREAKEKYLMDTAMRMGALSYRLQAKAAEKLAKDRKKADKDAEIRLRRQATLAGAPYRKIAESIGGRGIIFAAIRGLFKSLAGLSEGVGLGITKVFTFMGKTGGKVLSGLFEKVSDLFGEGTSAFSQFMSKTFSTMASGAQSAGAALVQVAGTIAASVSGMVALAAAVALATFVFGALQFVLGAVLAVVIPLVAGIAALVSEVAALAGVGLGGLLLLPGILLAGAAAFLPLTLVMQKFQDLLTKTSKKVGSLYEVFERLKNAIFAVISSGLVKAIQDLVVNVLPQLVAGITEVAAAWNRLFLFAAKFAATSGAIKTMNGLLDLGAQFVNAMADAAERFGPALLGFVTTSLPSLQNLLNLAVQLTGEFGAWIQSMVDSGQLATLFTQITNALGMIGSIARQTGPYLIGFITAVMPPATEFLALLGTLAKRWADFMQSAQGQQLIADFFTAMNGIISDLVPLAEQLFTGILALGPTFEDLNSAAVPALMAIVDIFVRLLDDIGPAMTDFLNFFNEAMRDPATLKAVDDLGWAISFIFAVLSENKEAVAVFIDGLAVLGIIAASCTIPLSLLADAFQAIKESTEKVTWITWLSPMAALKLAFSGTKDEAKDTGKALTDLGTNTSNATSRMGAGLAAVAGAKSWSQIQAESKLTAEYMVDMANNGITGNALLIDSLSKLAAAAYSTKNEADMATFEKNIGRAYTGASGGLQRANLSGFKKAGTNAGNAWSSGWNQAVDTSIKTASAKSAKRKPFLSNMKPMLSSLDAMTIIAGGKAYDTGKEIARYIAKGITSGSANIKKATDFIYKHYRGSLNTILAGVKNFNKKKNAVWSFFTKKEQDQFKKITTAKDMDAFLKKVKGRYEDLLKEVQGFKADVAGTLTANRGLVNFFGFIPTPAEVNTRLTEILDVNKKFTDGIAVLQTKKVDPALIREWIMAGPETIANAVEGLQNATSSEIDQINANYNQIGKNADAFAEQQAAVYFGLGENTIKGVISGIASMQTALNNEVAKAMRTAYNAAKTALKIKSPSQLFAGVGVDTMLGYIAGVDSKTTATVGAINDIYGAVTAVPPAQLATPTLARPGYVAPNAMAGLGGPAPIDVKVYLGTREITDIIRVEVDGYDTTRARALLAGRR